MVARSGIGRKFGFAAAVLLAGVVTFAEAARAEVSVSEPQPGMLVVEAHNAALDEVLAEIEKSQRMQVETTGPLAGSVSGTYRGPLSRVLVRLLAGYDVVVRSSPDGLQVKVLNPSGTRVAMPAAPGFPLHPAVSSNVDGDEQKALLAVTPSPTAAPPHPGSAAVQPVPRVPSPARTPSRPKISSNLDLDEEGSVGGN
jgi:hypothetical protein